MKALALLLFLAGCADDAPRSIGFACSTADDCESNLDCIELRDLNGTDCDPIGHVCSVPCTDDSTCAPFGSEYKCLGQCGNGPKFCEAIKI